MVNLLDVRPERTYSCGSGEGRMPPVLRLERISICLPHEFGAMRAEAASQGYKFLERLHSEWATGVARFDRDGEMLLAAHWGERLAAIGGLTFDPIISGALRMRRFYVRIHFRRLGIGRSLAVALLERSQRVGISVVVNAGSGSWAFWEALGFIPEAQNGHTHILSFRRQLERSNG